MLFADLDVMAVGPVVTEVAKDFDRYWNSNSSYPADRVLLPADRVATEHLSAAALQRARSQSAVAYASAVRRSAIIPDLMQGKLALEWAVAHMVSDAPAKGLRLAKPGTLIFDRLKATMGEPVTELNVVSPYFVPTEAGAAAFVAIARRGVKVRVLTNALEATDVAAVHSGYAKNRKTLLQAGISLYELRRLPTVSAPGYDRGFSGSSASSLHSKTFSFDRSRVFIGSINFDPRSAKLNTEMGIVIDSPVLAGRISAAFDQRIPAEAYQVGLLADGQLYWHERRGSKVLRHDVEPGTSAPRRAAVRLMSLLPIDWLL